MCPTQTKRHSFADIVSYTPPKLHTGKSWYVDFNSYDPAEERMKRKKYMLNTIEKLSDRRKYANELIAALNAKLRSGWNPWADVSNNRQYTLVENAFERYEVYLKKLLKSKAIKHNTLLDYTKRLKILQQYVEIRTPSIIYMYQFDVAFVSDFLDYMLLDRDVSARTRNNYRTWLSSLCNWFIEKQYLASNPVVATKHLTEDAKKRSPLSEQDLQKMKDYLEKENPHFLFLCEFAYYTFIRPEEITNIKLEDINIKEQKVYVSSEISKNRRDGMVALNDKLIRTMVKLNVHESPTSYYLFGKGFKPGKTKVTTKVYRNYFNKVREKLRFPDSYQFYSLKDTGIRDLANAEGIVIARDQARHADISTTNKYLKGSAMAVHNEVKHFKGNL